MLFSGRHQRRNGKKNGLIRNHNRHQPGDNSPQPLAVSRIVSAKIQVVAGFNYDLELELQNELNKDLIKCNVVVYDQRNTRRVTSCSCCGPSWTAAADHPEKLVVLPAALPAVELALPAAPDADAP